MAYTYSKIATYTVGSGGIPSVSFLNIPQNYTDLVLKVSARSDANNVFTKVYLNTDTTDANYRYRDVYGTGSTAASQSYSGPYGPFIGRSTYTASTFSNGELYIPNYTSTSTYKSVSIDSVSENNGTESYSNLVAWLWQNNSAVTSIQILPNAGSFTQHSTFHLYGIKAEL